MWFEISFHNEGFDHFTKENENFLKTGCVGNLLFSNEDVARLLDKAYLKSLLWPKMESFSLVQSEY